MLAREMTVLVDHWLSAQSNAASNAAFFVWACVELWAQQASQSVARTRDWNENILVFFFFFVLGTKNFEKGLLLLRGCPKTGSSYPKMGRPTNLYIQKPSRHLLTSLLLDEAQSAARVPTNSPLVS